MNRIDVEVPKVVAALILFGASAPCTLERATS
jgi:hypothetical protein